MLGKAIKQNNLPREEIVVMTKVRIPLPEISALIEFFARFTSPCAKNLDLNGCMMRMQTELDTSINTV